MPGALSAAAVPLRWHTRRLTTIGSWRASVSPVTRRAASLSPARDTLACTGPWLLMGYFKSVPREVEDALPDHEKGAGRRQRYVAGLRAGPVRN